MSNHESKQNNPRISSQITISSVFPVTSKSLRSPLSAAPHLPPWLGVPQQPERSQRPCSLHRSQAAPLLLPETLLLALETLPEFRSSTSYWHFHFQVLVTFNSDFLQSFCSPRSDTLCQQRAATCFSKFCPLFHFCLPFAHIIA